MEHGLRINHLLDYLESSRIMAGAEFEALCNENRHKEAELFCMVRDLLQVHIAIIKDYQMLN